MPEPTATPAPAAQTAATPSATAQPAAQTETPVSDSPVIKQSDAWMQDIDSLEAREPEVQPATPPPAKKEPTAKPESKQPDKQSEATPKPVKTAELRTAYESLKQRVKTEYEPQLQSLRAELDKLKSNPGDVNPATQKELESLRAENAALQSKLEYADYAESNEFKTKYAEPYRQAWKDALDDFKELQVREQDGKDDNDEPKFKVRAANENDLLTLAHMRLSEMDAAAQAMFGPSAARAIHHIQNLKRLSRLQSEALDQARQKALEWRNQRQTEAQRASTEIGKTWMDVNKTLETKFPKAFNPVEGDAEDQSAFQKGFALADLMFLGSQVLKPEQIENLPAIFRDTLKSGKDLSNSQKVQLHALARLKMANHDRKVASLNRALSRIKELETELAEFQASSPSAGSAAPIKTATANSLEDQVAAEIDKLE